jgi:hypothetical protein
MNNKNPLSRILVLFTLLCVNLTACTAAPALSPTAAMKIETPTPSATATEPPPATATPTATENPMANAPDDATGKDEKGYYKEVDGVKFYKAPEGLVDRWFRNGIENTMDNGGTYFMHDPENYFSPLISVQVNYQEGIDAPLIHHNTKPALDSGPSFSKNVLEALFLKDKSTDINQFYTDLYAGKISFPVTDSEGNTFELKINDKTTVKIFLVKPEDFPTGHQTKGELSLTTFEKDADGKVTTINIIVANNTGRLFESFSDVDFSSLLFRPAFAVFARNEKGASTLVGWSVRGSDPYFEVINPTP